MGRPRPAVGCSHSHSLDSVPSPGLGQRKYLCVGVPKGVYSERLLGAKTEIPGNCRPRCGGRRVAPIRMVNTPSTILPCLVTVLAAIPSSIEDNLYLLPGFI